MNVECTMQAMFNDYPDLFQSRTDCLNHLFCVIGNGYEWRNGELVCGNEKEKDYERLLVNGKAFQHKQQKQLYKSRHPRAHRWYFF